MENFPTAFGYLHHRYWDNFCQDGNLCSPGLPSSFSFHPRWENFLVDGIHLTCLTSGAEKSLLAMEQPWKRSFISVHQVWVKLLWDGKMCRNQIFHSIGVVISFWAMEESGWTSFSHTIGFSWSRKAMETSARNKLFTHHILQTHKMNGWFCTTNPTSPHRKSPHNTSKSPKKQQHPHNTNNPLKN